MREVNLGWEVSRSMCMILKRASFPRSLTPRIPPKLFAKDSLPLVSYVRTSQNREVVLIIV